MTPVPGRPHLKFTPSQTQASQAREQRAQEEVQLLRDDNDKLVRQLTVLADAASLEQTVTMLTAENNRWVWKVRLCSSCSRLPRPYQPEERAGALVGLC